MHPDDTADFGLQTALEQRYAAIAKDVHRKMDRAGQMYGSVIGTYLRDTYSFSPRSAGFSSLSNFFEIWCPFLKEIGKRGGDKIWVLVDERGPVEEAATLEHAPTDSHSDDPPGHPELEDLSSASEALPPIQLIDTYIRRRNSWFKRAADKKFLQMFCDALILHESTSPHAEIDSLQYIFDQKWSRKSQCFFGVCLLLLYAEDPDLFQEEIGFRLRLIKLLDGMPQVLRVVGVLPDQQNYEKLQALRSIPTVINEKLEPCVYALATLDSFPEARQQIMRTLNNAVVQTFVLPFLADATASQLEAALRAVQTYVDSESAEKVEALQQARSRIKKLIDLLEEVPTYFQQRYFLPITARLNTLVEEDFTASPLGRPAHIRARSTEKKHAFAVEGAEISISVIIENTADGHAFDVIVKVDAGDRVELADSSWELGNLQPNERFGTVEFLGVVTVPEPKPLWVHVTLNWTDSDGRKQQVEDDLVLEAQEVGIPWAELALQDPYSLEPVDDIANLVGRSELLSELEAKLRARNIGSFWIYGQKRVGKTSLVKSLESRFVGSNDGTLVIYLDAGDYITPDAATTIEKLGRKLCNSIQREDIRFRHIPMPEFRGAFSALDDFLRGVLDLDPTCRIIFILDEFDELPIDVYRRGTVGDAFFLTIRSISGKPNFGFVLVGGEKMELILSTQGDALNKFRPLRVDYFDRDTHWADFEDLIRKPLAPWGTITDRAVGAVYSASAGNPFFAKLICNTLFSDMCRRHDAFITDREMQNATSKTVNTAGSNQFQHFWEDGIFEISGDRIEERSMLRRRVLIALADVLRSTIAATGEEVVERAKGYQLPDYETRRELGEFERRNVLVRDQSGRYACKVGLFGSWLIERGVREIVISFTDIDAILERKRREEELRVTIQEITGLVANWGIFKGREMGEGRVRQWLDQFHDVEEQRLMFQILRSLRFYTSTAVRAKLREAHGIVTRELANRWIARRETAGAQKRTDNILISYIGQAGKSGPHYVRLYADENKIFVRRVVEPHRLATALRDVEDVHCLVIIDDFIGTGSQAIEGLREIFDSCAEILQARRVIVFYICVSGFSAAAERVEEAFKDSGVGLQVHLCEPLSDAHRCFSDTSTTFPAASERARAKDVATSYGAKLERSHPLGYGGCEATVVFEYNCPNNSLPILWKQTADWTALFPRY